MSDNTSLILDTNGRAIEQGHGDVFQIFRLSWVAHVREVWSFLARVFLCCGSTALLWLGLDRFAQMHTGPWLPILGLGVAIAWTVYSVMLTNSVRLFTNETGVWLQSGVFPWQRGITGVQWRDLGQAGYKKGFASWALRSYNVVITHRFTTGSELVLRNVHRGNLAVEHVNSVMAQLQGRIMPA